MTPARKKIIITMTYMHIGGAERSLLGLLHAIDYTQYDVDLFLFSHEGEFMDMIPPQVNLLPEISAYRTLVTPLNLRNGKHRFLYLMKKLGILLAAVRYKMMGRPVHEHGIMQYCQRLMLPWLPDISNRHYDLGISFLGFHDVISDKVKADVKLGWYHTDYGSVRPFMRMDGKMWNRLDKIVLVSESAMQSFLRSHPDLAAKACVIENILSPAFIRSQAQTSLPAPAGPEQGISLLTVGRLCEEKAYDRAMDACRILLDSGYRIKWTVLGEGHLESVLRERISKLNLQDHFILAGAAANPYPYFRHCDIYVQPSNVEGKSVSVREAQILGKPVIVTRYPTATSQIEDGIDGIITDMSAEAVAQAAARLIDHPELRRRLSGNCAAHDYGNEGEINHIYQMVP